MLILEFIQKPGVNRVADFGGSSALHGDSAFAHMKWPLWPRCSGSGRSHAVAGPGKDRAADMQVII